MIEAYSIYYIPNGPSRRNRQENYMGIKSNLESIDQLKKEIELKIGPVKIKTYKITIPFGYREPEESHAIL